MNRQQLLDLLRKGFQAFRTTIWFRVFYLVLLGVIVAQLYLFTQSALACLVFLLIPITVFIVPYWLGERKARNFAGNGLLVFLIAILVASALSTQAVFAQPDPFPLRSFPGFQSAPGLNLTNGTVRPYHGSPGESFTFRVNLTTTRDGTPDAYDVFVNLTVVDGFTISEMSHRMIFSPGPNSSSNPRNGTWYEGNVSLGGSVYIYSFSVTDRDRNWTSTVNELGPITASGWTFFGFHLYLTLLIGALPLEFLLYLMIVFVWWYMGRTRAARARMAQRPPETPKPPPTETSEPGAKAAKATAFTCTNCGSDVSQADAKCPKCGAVFED